MTRKSCPTEYHDPFTLSIFGSKLYVISDPKHTNDVYKNLKILSFIEFVQGLFKRNELSAAGLKAVYANLPTDKPGFPNPQGGSLGENELRAVGVGTNDIATILVTLHWAINTNTRKTAFWVLTYLLYNPSHIEPLRRQTANAFVGDKLFETLRMSSNAASVRNVNKDTVIGYKHLRKGNRIMIPYRLLHFDESVYGPDVYSFKPERFAGSNAEKLTRGDSWRPFGGGKTMCSGRHIAKCATLMFLSLVLRKFDIEIVGGRKMPAPDLDITNPSYNSMASIHALKGHSWTDDCLEVNL
uniref:Cytochrome P450 n=1 Tax=Talaromyces marneffei PM1 TaxID=1077442 RepID=A0A093VLB8_TALMA